MDVFAFSCRIVVYDTYTSQHKKRNQDHTVQMLARIGYAPDIGPAPRERLKTQLVPL